MLEDLDLGPVELEPNVGFDMDEEPAREAETQVFSSVHKIEAEEEALFDDYAPAVEPEPEAEPESELVADLDPPAPLTTREIIERARANARASSEKDRAGSAAAAPRAAPTIRC